MRTDESHVRKVIHAFSEEGFDSLDPDYRGGRPKKTTPCERDLIVALTRARPDTQGVPLTRCSLTKLAPQLAGMGIFLSREALRRLLIDAGLSHQRTRPWKWSPGPRLQRGDRRVRRQERRLPRLGQPRQGDGRARPLPQRTAPRPAADPSRTSAADRRLSPGVRVQRSGRAISPSFPPQFPRRSPSSIVRVPQGGTPCSWAPRNQACNWSGLPGSSDVSARHRRFRVRRRLLL
jgi:transposase